MMGHIAPYSGETGQWWLSTADREWATVVYRVMANGPELLQLLCENRAERSVF